jgi:NDP-sugar pyrophosphorylase family protein
MQAVILAGGLGTRLGSRTERTPKALLEVAGRPFLGWQLEKLASAGFSDVLLCIGHLGEQIREFVGDGAHFDLSVKYSEDGPRLLGTAGALRTALPKLSELFLVTYGDSYLPFDYAAPVRDLEAHPDALGCMSVYRNEGRFDASNCKVEADWVRHYEKGTKDPAFDYIDYGAIALRREVIAALKSGEPYGLDKIQNELSLANKLRAHVATQRFFEIGSEQGLSELELELSQERKDR